MSVLDRLRYRARVWVINRLRRGLDGDDWLGAGHVRVVVEDEDGDIRRDDVGRNWARQSYVEHLVDRLDKNQSPAEAEATHFAIGTDDSVFPPSSGLLHNEINREGLDTGTYSEDADGLGFTIEGTFTAADTEDANGTNQTIYEVGMVDDSIPQPINRVNFLDGGDPGPIDLADGEEATVTFSFGFIAEEDAS